MKPAFVRSPPLLAPSTSVIVASESKSCLLPSAFFANAQAVLAISWGLKRAARFCCAISEAIAVNNSEDDNSAVEKAHAKFEKPWGWNSATRGAASLEIAPKSLSCLWASPAAANAHARFDRPWSENLSSRL